MAKIMYQGLFLEAKRDSCRGKDWKGTRMDYRITDPRDKTILVEGVRSRDWHTEEVLADLRALVDVVKTGLLREETDGPTS